jgi:hypothetical protein
MTSKKIKRTKSPKLTPGTRKEIAELYKNGKGMKRQEIAKYIGCSVYQVDAVIYKKVKMKKSDRSDKGLSRKKSEPEQLEKLTGKDQRDIVTRLKDALESSVIDLEKRNYAPDDKISLIEKASRLLKNLQAMELQSHMKGTNAELIIRIMLRFNPDLSIDEIKKIYLEETEKLKQNSD